MPCTPRRSVVRSRHGAQCTAAPMSSCPPTLSQLHSQILSFPLAVVEDQQEQSETRWAAFKDVAGEANCHWRFQAEQSCSRAQGRLTYQQCHAPASPGYSWTRPRTTAPEWTMPQSWSSALQRPQGLGLRGACQKQRHCKYVCAGVHMCACACARCMP